MTVQPQPDPSEIGLWPPGAMQDWLPGPAAQVVGHKLCVLGHAGEARILNVEQSVTVQKSGRTYATPKNHESRDVGIDPRTAGVLRGSRKAQGLSGSPGVLHFATSRIWWSRGRTGGPVAPNWVSRAFVDAHRGERATSVEVPRGHGDARLDRAVRGLSVAALEAAISTLLANCSRSPRWRTGYVPLACAYISGAAGA